MNIYRTVLAYLKKKSLVAIKPWDRHAPSRSEDLFRRNHTLDVNKGELSSLRFYTGTGFTPINDHLRGKVYPETHINFRNQDEIIGHIDNIDAAMDRSPLKTDVALWRGMPAVKSHPIVTKLKELGGMVSKDGSTRYEYDKALKLKGFTYKEHSYLSTSLNRSIGESFNAWPEIILKIEAKAGTQAIYIPGAQHLGPSVYDPSIKDVDSAEDGQKEFEVLLDRGLTYEVTNVIIKEKGNELIVSVRVK